MVRASGKGALIPDHSSSDCGFEVKCQRCFNVLTAHKLPAEQVPLPAVLSKKTTVLASLGRQGTGTRPRGSCRLCIPITQVLLSCLGTLGQALALTLLLALLQASGLAYPIRHMLRFVVLPKHGRKYSNTFKSNKCYIT